jgi:hypothetical protein
MPRSVGCAWNNDVALAYEIVGTGSVDLLLLAGAASNLDVQWGTPPTPTSCAVWRTEGD